MKCGSLTPKGSQYKIIVRDTTVEGCADLIAISKFSHFLKTTTPLKLVLGVVKIVICS